MEAYNGGMSTKQVECGFCGAKLIRKSAPSVKSRVHFCDLKCKAQKQREAKPVSREWLVEHYIDKKLDCTQIAHMVKRDPKSVWNWLKDFGIPTRPRGNPFCQQRFKKGMTSPFKGKKHTDEFKRRASERCKAEGRMPYKAENGPPMRGKKGAETSNWKGGHTPERQAFYSSPEWKSASREVKRRDNQTCQRCGKVKLKGSREPFDIHHIVPFACVELRAVVSNLVYLCEPCHYWIHGPENTEKLFIKEQG